MTAYPLNRTKISDSIYFSSVVDARYKTNRISINLFIPLQKETVSANALIPFVLRKGCADYPDFTQLNQKLYSLYGSYLDTDVRKSGDNQVIGLSITGIDNAYTLEGENIIKEMTDILFAILLRPCLPDGLFSEKELNLERQMLIDLIESEINEKRSYAIRRALETMCAGDPYGIDKYGTVEQVKSISQKELTEAYRSLIRSASIEILFVGCGNPEIALQETKKAFADMPHLPAAGITSQAFSGHGPVKEKTEKLQVSQSKLVMGFSTGVHAADPDINAMRLMTALYGGTPLSRLFQHVREKLSLCYYCAARFDRAKGILLVDSGVEKQNIQKAKEEILRQLAVIQDGAFTDQEFEQAVLSMVDNLKSVNDSLGGTEAWYLQQICYGTKVTPEEEAQNLRQITRDDVIAAAQKVRLDTIYVLTGEEE